MQMQIQEESHLIIKPTGPTKDRSCLTCEGAYNA